MEENKNNPLKFTLFWKWFLNNKLVTGLLIVLLSLLIIFMLPKAAYILQPIFKFLQIVGLPIILAGVLYYLINPLIDYLEQKGVKRILSITGVYLLIIGLIIWGIAILVPIMQKQTASFIHNWPHYWQILSNKTEELMQNPYLSEVEKQLNNFNNDVVSVATKKLNGMVGSTVSGLGNILGTVTTILVGLIVTPFLLFYLLKDGHKLPKNILQIIPNKMRDTTYKVLTEINQQISRYIRGQLTVAFCVAIMFVIGYSIIGMDFGITLGILAGFMNLIPYLGSFLAMLPAVIIGLVDSPLMLVKVLLLFAIEQLIEGKLISPLVLGSNLEIHPVTIIFVLLTAGKIFGLPGVILGIPGYAVLKVIVTHVFEWYKDISGLYHADSKLKNGPPITKE